MAAVASWITSRRPLESISVALVVTAPSTVTLPPLARAWAMEMAESPGAGLADGVGVGVASGLGVGVVVGVGTAVGVGVGVGVGFGRRARGCRRDRRGQRRRVKRAAASGWASRHGLGLALGGGRRRWRGLRRSALGWWPSVSAWAWASRTGRCAWRRAWRGPWARARRGTGRGSEVLGFGDGLTTQSPALLFVSVTLPPHRRGGARCSNQLGRPRPPCLRRRHSRRRPSRRHRSVSHPSVGRPTRPRSPRCRPCTSHRRTAHRCPRRVGNEDVPAGTEHGGRWSSRPGGSRWSLPMRHRQSRARSSRSGAGRRSSARRIRPTPKRPPVTTSEISNPAEVGQATAGRQGSGLRRRHRRCGRHRHGNDRPQENERGQGRTPGSNHRRPPGGDSRSGSQLYRKSVSRPHRRLTRHSPGGGRARWPSAVDRVIFRLGWRAHRYRVAQPAGP